jgi:scyllo-inositol 2-dehydrogenase (NADP+)
MIKGNIDAAVEPESEYATIYGPDNAQTRLPTTPGRWRSFYENVTDAITGKAQPAVTLDQMRRLMAVFDAIWESAGTGQVVAPKV